MYGTKKTTKSINKGAPVGKDLENNKKVSAEKVETKVEGSKTTDTEDLIKNDPESKKAYEEISREVNRKDDEQKEEKAREEVPGATTEVINNIGVTKDDNTGKNENAVKEEPKDAPVPETLKSEDGKETKIDVNNVVDVPSQEKTQAVEEKVDNKVEDKKSTGIQSMFADEEEDIKEDSKEFSKQDDVKTEAPIVETKVVLPKVESTEEETAKVVAEEKSVEETKSAPKAEVVETKKEVKQQNKVTEEKVEEPAKVNATFADTVVTVNRAQNATFVVTSGRVVSVQNSDEQIAVSNNGSSIVVTNNYPEFDGTVSFNVVDEAGQATSLTVIFK
jgi:hypothetical protein